MPRLILSDEALRDLDRLQEFRLQHSERSAKRAVDAIRADFPLLLAQPGIGRQLKDRASLREWNVRFGRSAYHVQYRIIDGDVFVTSIRHNREERRNT